MAKFYGGGVNSITAPFANEPSFITEKVTVVTAGTPVNLPSILIPDGRELTIRAKVSNGKKLIYVANSSANALLAASRVELAAGEGVGLFVTNANAVWINSNANNQDVELLVEQP